jgi:SAM-dependent MidA family methyltransferase
MPAISALIIGFGLVSFGLGWGARNLLCSNQELKRELVELRYQYDLEHTLEETEARLRQAQTETMQNVEQYLATHKLGDCRFDEPGLRILNDAIHTANSTEALRKFGKLE